MLEKTLESPLDCKEVQPVHPQGHQPWTVTGRTEAETETPILWPPDEKSRFIGKDSDAGKNWRWEEKGTTEDERVGWHLNGREMDVSLSKLRETVKNRKAWRAVIHGVTKRQARLSNWTRRTIEEKGRESSWQYSNGSAHRPICFQGERETPHSFQTCGPCVSHRHENFPEAAGLDAMREHGRRPQIPWILARVRNIMVLFIFFSIFELASVDIHVVMDLILEGLVFRSLLPILLQTVTDQPSKARLTSGMFWFHWFYRPAECAVLTYKLRVFLFHFLLPRDLRHGLAGLFCRVSDCAESGALTDRAQCGSPA